MDSKCDWTPATAAADCSPFPAAIELTPSPDKRQRAAPQMTHTHTETN